MDLSNYFIEKEQYAKDNKVNMVKPAPAQSPLFNRSILFKTIDDRNMMAFDELCYFIERNFQSIMNNVFTNDSNAGRYIQAFTESYFLDAFIQVISRMQDFDDDVKVRLNLIAYHYSTSPISIPDIANRMNRISRIVNQRKLIGMAKFNYLSDNLKVSLITTRYSDFDIAVCVRRINLMMVRSEEIYKAFNINEYECSPDDESRLADLLMELFKPEEWIYVLPNFMIDKLPDNDGTRNTSWITPEVENIDSALNLAVLRVLDEKIPDPGTVYNILMDYSEGYKLLNSRKPLRFSFRKISEEYSRLHSIINDLEYTYDILVP